MILCQLLYLVEKFRSSIGNCLHLAVQVSDLFFVDEFRLFIIHLDLDNLRRLIHIASLSTSRELDIFIFELA